MGRAQQLVILFDNFQGQLFRKFFVSDKDLGIGFQTQYRCERPQQYDILCLSPTQFFESMERFVRFGERLSWSLES